ncbi:hypothetical protein TH66_19720 [Carbonactinospora thermoautotrophica]|uniref:Hydrogenase-4 component E n=2 Tax=Carbonactinospora thermoautotrophica TaxID=1469144 RepID=A0A132MK83_9ACTN|nr:hypothetical protein TH66_19720 [Carbonactinospora thermoautotrophica]
MHQTLFVQSLDLACGVFLLTAVGVLWRRELSALVRLLAVQGAALAAIAGLLAVHESSTELAVVAAVVAGLKAVALPRLLRRALDRSASESVLRNHLSGSPAPASTPAALEDKPRRYEACPPPCRRDDRLADRTAVPQQALRRETRPLVNVAASLLAAAALTLLAYAAARPLVALAPSPVTRAAPVGLAVVLIGFFLLATRRRAVSQIVGVLLVDNGIAAVAFLTTAGVPLIVELGVSLDLLLAVLVMQVLTTRLQAVFGGTDLDELRELRDS